MSLVATIANAMVYQGRKADPGSSRNASEPPAAGRLWRACDHMVAALE
jgi:hypothetical protein